VEKEVSHNEMVEYYQAHRKDYEQPARVRWEQLRTHFERFPSKEAAYARLAEMGNDVLRGVPWDQVARASSHGATAKEGGRRDWTTQGSLTSQVLNQALFSLPPGAPSPILEDERGFHIVRVVERQEAGCTPFRDAQLKIKEQIEKERREKAVQEYYAKLRKETLVWTVFDDPQTAQRFAQSIKGAERR
jgi:parvulin-like peptidyl-prolyl isomerase